MKVKITIGKLTCSLSFYFPVIYSILSLISDDYARTAAQAVMVLLLMCEIGNFAHYGRSHKRHLVFLIFLVLMCLANAALFGYAYLMSLDFYGYILLMLVFLVYSEDQYLDYIKDCMLNRHKSKKLILLFWGVLLVSCIWFNGLRSTGNWGISFPILYGPFSLPHNLAYLLMILYCVASIQLRVTGNKIFLATMVLTGIAAIFTGARSGILGIFMLAGVDYLSIRGSSKKLSIAVVGLLILLYLGLFTDVLLHNPLVEKTLSAYSSGSITNGREIFSSYLMGHYINDTTAAEKIFGIGLTGIRALMRSAFGGSGIHAHNDFVNILMGFGVLGFVPYLVAFIAFCRKSSKLLFSLSVLGMLAFYNGLYMYIEFTISMPIIIVFLKQIYASADHASKKNKQVDKSTAES